VIEYRAKEILLSALERMADVDSERPMPMDTLTIDALRFGKQLIEDNVEEDISLEFLCRKTGLNEYKFKKGFKTLFQSTAIDYHIHLKMGRAKQLLIDTNQSVSEIAYTLGYHHSSNFSIEFKRRFGCTPKDFRKLGRK
jgi:AraC family transcriptional regulator, transcriptional activator of the genes for pyochelin and ferripyochelin receptors